MNQLLRKLISCCIFFIPAIAAHTSTYYWVGDGGEWADYSNHWATSSGGASFYTQAPGPADDVVFDVNSFTTTGQIVLLDSGDFSCRNFTWNSVPYSAGFGDDNNFNFSTVGRIYGSVVMDTTITWRFHGTVSFESTQTGNIIDTHNAIGLRNVVFNGTGTWELASTFMFTYLNLNNGTFKTNGYALNCNYSISKDPGGTCYFFPGTSTIYNVYGFLDLGESQLHTDGDSATFITPQFTGKPGDHYKKVEIFSVNSYLAFIGNSLTVDELDVDPNPYGFFNLASNGSQFGVFNCYVPCMLYYTNTFGAATFYNDVTTDDNDTFDTLRLSNPGYTCSFRDGKTVTVNGALVTNTDSCAGGFITVKSTQSGTQATISKSSGAVVCYNLSLQDIAATGGASFTASHSVVISNVTGWTITVPAPRSLYWVGGTGSWSDAAHWSLTSNGTGGNCPPTQVDNVTFNNHSFASGDTLIVDLPGAQCNSMTWTSNIAAGIVVTNNGQTNGSWSVYGNLVLRASLNWQFAGQMNFSGSSSQTIKTNNVTLKNVGFNGSGNCSLLSGLHCDHISHVSGTLHTQNHNIHCRQFESTGANARSIYLGASTIFTATWFTSGSSLAIFADSSEIRTEDFQNYTGGTFNVVKLALDSVPLAQYCRLEGSDTKILNLTGKDVVSGYTTGDTIVHGVLKRDFTISGGTLTAGTLECRRDFFCNTSVNADTVNLSTTGSALVIQSGVTLQTNQLLVNATCGSYSTIVADNPASSAYISIPSGTVNLSYLILNGITATGGATFNAFNSLVISNVHGWNVTSPSPRTLYWVGGTGKWKGTAHWSLSSGGPGGECQPNFLDDVIFDDNSFASSADTVYLNSSTAYCHNLTWQTSSNPVVDLNTNDDSGIALHIFGSFALDTGITWNYPGEIVFEGSGTSKTIRTAMVTLKDLVFRSDSSSWILQDSLSCEFLLQENGALLTAGNNVTCSFRFQLQDSTDLDTSVIRTQYFNNYSPAAQFDGDSARIECSYFDGNGQLYKKVWMGNASFPEFYAQNCTINDYSCQENMRFYNAANNTFGHATFLGDAELVGDETFGTAEFHGQTNLYGDNTFDTLVFDNPNRSVNMQELHNQVVNNSLVVNSGPGAEIDFFSMSNFDQPNLVCGMDTVCIDYVSMENIYAVISGVFYAGTNSTDLGGNSYISFTECGSEPVYNNSGRQADISVAGTSPGPSLGDDALVFPNPTNGNATLLYPAAENESITIELYDEMGRRIFAELHQATTKGNYSCELPMQDLPAGMYNCRIISGEKSKVIHVIKTE